MKKQHRTFADIIGDFANAPYNENGWGQEGVVGYSCLGLCYAYCMKRGYNLPEDIKNLKFENLSMTTYHEYARHQKGLALIKLFRLFNTLGKDIPINQRVAGDLVLVKVLGETYPAIYVGNNQIMSAYADAGVKVVKLNKDVAIMMVRRF